MEWITFSILFLLQASVDVKATSGQSSVIEYAVLKGKEGRNIPMLHDGDSATCYRVGSSNGFDVCLKTPTVVTTLRLLLSTAKCSFKVFLLAEAKSNVARSRLRRTFSRIGEKFNETQRCLENKKKADSKGELWVTYTCKSRAAVEKITIQDDADGPSSCSICEIEVHSKEEEVSTTWEDKHTTAKEVSSPWKDGHATTEKVSSSRDDRYNTTGNATTSDSFDHNRAKHLGKKERFSGGGHGFHKTVTVAVVCTAVTVATIIIVACVLFKKRKKHVIIVVRPQDSHNETPSETSVLSSSEHEYATIDYETISATLTRAKKQHFKSVEPHLPDLLVEYARPADEDGSNAGVPAAGKTSEYCEPQDSLPVKYHKYFKMSSLYGK